MSKQGGIRRKIMLKATLVTDPLKSVFAEVSETDTIRNLQVTIGEEMKIRHHETFQNLEGVRAFNITMDKNKQLDLKDHFLVMDYLDDSD